MKKTKVPGGDRGHNHCWAEHPETGVHCTEPIGHPPRKTDDGQDTAGHWHPYTKTSW